MTASPILATEQLEIVPGPALLATPSTPGLRDHRARYGDLPVYDAEGLARLTEAAGIRGRGGAGFPFATKLTTTARHSRALRRPVVVVNASEGEPASAKDAALAMVAPHLVLDGAAVSARALASREIHVVLPHDRPRAAGLMAAAVAERNDEGLRWTSHTSESRFVAGQSRAVMELLAGRPALPVTSWRPEAIDGHRGRPTLLSNAETWAHVGLLAVEGLAATLGRGTTTEPGTTLLTVHAPGVPVTIHEVEHGTPLTKVLPASARQGPVLLGGFHGTWASWETVSRAAVSAQGLRAAGIALGAGVVIAPGPAACPLAWTDRIVSHLASQSAGRCGPCFNGLPALAQAVHRLTIGDRDARTEVEQITGLVSGRGACAHPDGTARLVASLLTAFPQEVTLHEQALCSCRAALEVIAS